MFRNIRNYLITVVLLTLIYYWISPGKAISSYYILIGVPTVFFVFYNRIQKGVKSKINLGAIYFIAMGFFLVAGNLTAEIILFMYPDFDVRGMDETNIYWLAGMCFFALGFILTKRRMVNKKRYLYTLNKKYIFILFALSLFATFYAIVKLGFIPVLNSNTGNERFLGEIASTTIVLRLWECGVVSAILAVIYYFNIKRNIYLIYISIFSFLFTTIFFVRIFPALVIVSVGLFIFSIVKDRKKLIIIASVAVPLFLFINTVMIDYRSDFQRSESQTGNTSVAQTSVVSFSEDYTILNSFIRDYKGDYYYGQTFLAMPVAFIPSQILAIFGIEKIQILHNTSARIVADFYDREAEGLRIGLMGELYLNFGFFGAIFMFFAGYIAKVLQVKIEAIHNQDYRLGFYFLFFAIVLYSIDAQIDAIGILVADFLLLFILTKPFLRKFHY